MTAHRSILILIASLAMLTLAGAEAAPHVVINGHEVASDRVIVLWRDAATATSPPTDKLLREKLARLADLAASKRSAFAQFTTVKTFAKLPGVAVLKLATTSGATAKAATNAAGDGGVAEYKARVAALVATGQFAFVEPDYIVHADTLPDDAALADGRLWGLRNVGQNGGVAGTDIGASAAWDVTTGSPNVVVAVIDTGIRYTHQELVDNMWRNPGEIANNGIDDDHDGYVDDVFGINAITGSGDPFDDNNHGTHVAGTIGAAANGGGPHVGIAWNVRLMALKFLSANGSGSLSDAIECIDFAIAKGAKVMSNSWGGGGFSTALANAIERAGAANIVFVAAAGNEGADNDVTPAYPASYEQANIISVAAIDRRNQRASFSNVGRTTVDIAAPGVDIFSSVASSNSSYDFFSGTSMATPHVSGVAALLLARFPGIRVADLKQRLLATAVPVPSLLGATVSGGRVNAAAALTVSADGTLELAAQVPSLPLRAGGSSAVFVSVKDLTPITDATVSAHFGEVTAVALLDNGVAPDALTGDGVYSALLDVPAGGSSVHLTVNASAPGKLAASGSFDYAVAAEPDNNAFAARTVIAAGVTRSTGSNVNSSFEPGEPHNPVVAGNHSVWWSWTAASTGAATITTAGSSFDTTLAVYTGGALDSLNLLQSNDDSGGLQSSVTFNAQAGAIYAVQVNGYADASGDVVLNHPSVGNATGVPVITDEPHDTAALVGTAFQLSVTASGDALSYQWSFNDTPIIGANSAVYRVESSSLGDAGAYRVVVSNVQGMAASRAATVTIERVVALPGNDAFASAIDISGSGRLTGDNRLATGETGEPNHGNVSEPLASLWYRYNAPAAGTLTVNTAGSNFDTTLAAYTGTAVNLLNEVAFNDDSAGTAQSRISLHVEAGATDYLAVDGFRQAAGDITVDYSFEPDQGSVPNDAFSNASDFVGTSMVGSNIGASGEPGEPDHGERSSPLASVWWRWTAPFTGIAEFNTLGSDFDTTLALYSGATVDLLTLRAANDDFDGQSSRVRFAVVAGRTYYAAVDGFAAAEGNVVLGLTEVTGYARPDVFARAPARLGMDVYYPQAEQLRVALPRGGTGTIRFYVRNTGNQASRFVIRLGGTVNGPGFASTLLGSAGNVTRKAVAGSLQTELLAPGQLTTYTLRLRRDAQRATRGYNYDLRTLIEIN